MVKVKLKYFHQEISLSEKFPADICLYVQMGILLPRQNQGNRGSAREKER
jgi:hypothetical protein